MKKYLLLLLAILSINLYAQDFAPIGAIWHYSQGTINPQLKSFKTIESVSDTIINGINCVRLIETDRYLISPRSIEHFVFMSNDSVFFYKENDFHLLYDFGAIQGDTIVLSYFQTSGGGPLKMVIDSIGSISINDDIRKIQYVTCGDGILVEFGDRVISGIGNTWYLFPMYDNESHGPLRCYEDDSIGLFINTFNRHPYWTRQDCDQEIILSIDDKLSNNLSVYPNPTTSMISIDNMSFPAYYRIFNISGCYLMGGDLVSSNEVDFGGLENGIYLLEISTKDYTMFRKIVKY